MSSNVVPFGKYKGQPVEDMLADHEYMAWVEAQPWFRDRYLHLLSRRDADAASRTPVHNKLQTLFLDEAYQLAFLSVVSRQFQEAQASASTAYTDTVARVATNAQRQLNRIAEMKAEIEAVSGRPTDWYIRHRQDNIVTIQTNIDAEAALLKSYLTTPIIITHQLEVGFELQGADVWLSWDGIRPYLALQGEAFFDRTPCIANERFGARLPIEIKPTVADEYPAVLRQMTRNKSEILFVGEYQGAGATEAQFVAIFQSSGKRVVFKRNVDRAVAETMLARLDAAGIGLTLQPSGKVTVTPGAQPAPELLASAKVHREAIIALLLDRARGAAVMAQPVQDDTL